MDKSDEIEKKKTDYQHIPTLTFFLFHIHLGMQT